jgi:predicted nucleic-acid-binding protein
VIAFDTCLLVRFLAEDDPEQADIAENLMREHTIFLPNTVLLETEWVLRSRYKKERNELVNFFKMLPEIENVVLEEPVQYEKAVTWYALGADFADAMHLAACEQATLYTFDRNFCKKARELMITPDFLIVDAKYGSRSGEE